MAHRILYVASFPKATCMIAVDFNANLATVTIKEESLPNMQKAKIFTLLEQRTAFPL